MRREIMQPWGLVHGGVYASIAESLASWATALAVVPRGELAMGQSNNTQLPAADHARARSTRSRRAATAAARRWVWDVDITDDDGRLCATSRVTVAVRPRGDRGAARAQPR